MFKITGLEEFQRKLEKLQRNVESLGGEHSVPLKELFTDSFMARHTKFATLDDFFSASGFKVDTPEDFKAIPDDKMDEYVRSASNFENWEAMKSEAVKEWARRKLSL